MKINCHNKFIKTHEFSDVLEARKLYEQRKGQKVFLNNTYGDYHFLIESCDSLNGMSQLIICFSSDKSLNQLNLLIWEEFNVWVLETTHSAYIIDSLSGQIIKTFHLLTPIIGFYNVNDRLLILEEARVLIIDAKGSIINEQSIDLIDTYELCDNTLFVNTWEGEKIEFQIQ